MNDVIKLLLAEWHNKKLPEVFPREIDLSVYLNLKVNKILSISGFRRAGKTYLLYFTIKNLLEKLTREDVIYFNLEDERISQKTEFLSNLIPVIQEINNKHPKLLFLDEIQTIPNWSQWLRRVYDNYNIRFIITGSSSKVSASEVPEELRGRCLDVTVYPLSFKEYLSFNKTEVPAKKNLADLNLQAIIKSFFLNFLENGGLPEVILMNEEMVVELVQSYFQTVVKRDIVTKNKIKNEEALITLVKLLLNSREYSITKLYNTLKSMNIKIGKSNLQQYVGYIEKSYFLFSLTVFSYKIKDQYMHPRKAYFIDNSFLSYLTTKHFKNHGRLFENLVALEIKKSSKDVFYWKSEKNNYEVDFVIKDDLKVTHLIQACYDISEEKTKIREIRGLLHASKELNCKKLLILTMNFESEEKCEWFGLNGNINIMPLWKWTLYLSNNL